MMKFRLCFLLVALYTDLTDITHSPLADSQLNQYTVQCNLDGKLSLD